MFSKSMYSPTPQWRSMIASSERNSPSLSILFPQDTLGGRFDATQAFIGEISDFNMWGHILTPGEVYKMATCTSHVGGDLINWAEAAMELHGGVVKLPFNACH